MKKTAILATAIAAVIAAPLASAAKHEGKGPHVTVYGVAHASLNNNDQADNWTVKSNASRLGFKGSEDLGNGMKATFQMEMGYDLTDGAGVTGTNRNSYVGLAGGFGEVRVGRHDTPAKAAFYSTGNDLLGDSIIDLNGLQGFTERRVSNAIAYISPDFGGIKVAAAFVPGESSNAVAATPASAAVTTTDSGGDTVTLSPAVAATAGTAATNNGLADATSFGVMYSGGPIKASLGYTDASELLNGGADNNLMQLGVSYKMDNIHVGFNYETLDVGAATTTTFALSAQMSFDANAVIINFGNQEVDPGNGGAKADADSTGFAFKHSLSKRTAAYVAVASSDTKSKEKTSFGLTHKF